MNAQDYINTVKKVNGHGQEIIQCFDKETGMRVFTAPTFWSDDEIRENAMFELDYDSKELREAIAEHIISLK